LAPVTRAGRDPAEARPVPGQRLREVQRRGLLRVGYFSDGMPWAFVNAKGELVGHDVEAAHRFATQLGLGLEFVPVKRADPALSRALDEGVVDVIMTGMTATLARAERMSLSHPYAQEHMGFLAHDHDRDRFSSLVNLAAGEGLVIAVPPVESASDFVKGLLPAATIRAYESVDEAIADAEVSAILTSLERAYYWSRVRPELCAVMPEGAATAANAVYAVPRGEQELQGLVDLWIDTRRASGEEEEAYTYWVRGRALAPRAPRWSVLHDVLGWRGR
jgi:ABC-type amino acid transport substrate-binding protein